MNNPLVSAICTTYKSERYMRGLLEDLEAQTIADRMEIVIFDSASPENERAIVEEFQTRHGNIRYFRTAERENSHVALNRCIAEARGTYLTLANTDDRHRPDAVELLVRALEQRPDCGLAWGDSLITHVENDTIEQTTAALRFDWPDYTLAAALSTFIFGPHPLWRRTVHAQAGVFDPGILLAGDLDLFTRIAWRCGAVHVRETLGLFLRRDDSNSGRNNRDPLLAETYRILHARRREAPLEDVYPGLKACPEDPHARTAALWDYANVCALSPYPDFDLALQKYAEAVRAAGAIPGANETLRPMLAVNAGVIACCRGEMGTGRRLLREADDLPAAKTNLERLEAMERRGAPLLAVNFALTQLTHDVIASGRAASALCLDEHGDLVSAGPRVQVAWDVYAGPNGVPVAPEELARIRARKPRRVSDAERVVGASAHDRAALAAVPVAAEESPLHVLLMMYGWDDEGGGTLLPRHIAKLLARRGHRVSVIAAASRTRAGQPPYHVERFEDDGVRVFSIFNRPALFFDYEHPEREINDPEIRRVIRRLVDTLRPDVVHYHSLLNFSMRAAEDVADLGIPSVYSSHNFWPLCPRLYLLKDAVTSCAGPDANGGRCAACTGQTGKAELYAMRLAAGARILSRAVDRHIAPSQRVRELCVRAGHDPARIHVLRQCPVTVNALWDQVGLPREPVARRQGPLRVGCFGSLLPLKGIHVLAHALQAFHPGQIEAHVFGSGSEEYLAMLRKIDAKGLLRFHGRYEAADLPRLLREVDVVVTPSVCEEPAQLVVMEALAARAPVIASRIGGFPDYVQEGVTGMLFTPGDADGLAAALRRFVQDPALLGRMQAAIPRPQRFEEYVDALVAQYRQVIAARQEEDHVSGAPEEEEESSLSAASAALASASPASCAAASLGEAAVVWEGSQFVHHSLAFINRELCLRLIRAGHHVSILPYERDQFGASADPRFGALAARVRARLPRPPDVHVRHHWPPNLNPPPEGHWVMIQPWEFGSVPTEWIEVMRRQLDELWVPSRFVRESYIRSGLPADRVFVIPNGVDTEKFRPDAPPLKLATARRFKFLFVGGTIYRKGADVLLNAYRRAFTAGDDVCLVIKDVGGKTCYKGQTAEDMIRKFQALPNAPEVLHLTDDLLPDQLPGLYTACDCFVHPYRGEGFGMPISEAMACGRPVIVTGAGACLDFCDESTAYLIPAARKPFPENKVDHWATPQRPFLYEPDADGAARWMRHVYDHPNEARAVGVEARRRIQQGFTWDHAAALVESRIRALRAKPIRRAQADTVVVVLPSFAPDAAVGLGECLRALAHCTRHVKALAVQVVNPSGPLPDVPLPVQILEGASPAAVVQAALASDAQRVILLGDDVRVTPRWLEGLLRAAASDPKTAAVGPTADAGPDAQRIESAPPMNDRDLDKFAAKRAYQYGNRVESVSHLGLFCLLLDCRAVREIGGLNASQALADAVWEVFVKLRERGWRLLCARGVFVRHAAYGLEDGSDYDARAQAQSALQLHLTAGTEAIERGDLSAAVAEFTRLTEAYPDSAAGHAALAATLLALGALEEGAAALRRAIELDPNDIALYNQLGVALARQQDFTAAESAFEKARALSPDSLDAWLNLVELYRSRKEYARAIDLMGHALKRFTDCGDLLAAFATLTLEIGGAPAARQALEHLRAVDPNHPAVQRIEEALHGATPPRSGETQANTD